MDGQDGSVNASWQQGRSRFWLALPALKRSLGVRFRTALCVSEHPESSFVAPNQSVVVLFSSIYGACRFGTKTAISYQSSIKVFGLDKRFVSGDKRRCPSDKGVGYA
jgi:hypothetical protein